MMRIMGIGFSSAESKAGRGKGRVMPNPTGDPTMNTILRQPALYMTLLAVLSAGVAASEETVATARPVAVESSPAKPKVQIALLLDTSGSMDGLLAQAKTQLWKIVNEFALSKKN